MLKAFIRFYFSRTVGNWRALRRECMSVLPDSKPKAAP